MEETYDPKLEYNRELNDILALLATDPMNEEHNVDFLFMDEI